MNETLIRSPKEERSIQNTDHESITISIRGTITKRTMKNDSLLTSMLTTNAEATPALPA